MKKVTMYMCTAPKRANVTVSPIHSPTRFQPTVRQYSASDICRNRYCSLLNQLSQLADQIRTATDSDILSLLLFQFFYKSAGKGICKDNILILFWTQSDNKYSLFLQKALVYIPLADSAVLSHFFHGLLFIDSLREILVHMLCNRHLLKTLLPLPFHLFK